MNNLEPAKSLHEQIKEALVNEWDPIGVKGVPGALNEYDGYIPKIYEMLIQRKTKQDIFKYLWWVETEHMGLVGNKQSTEKFTDRLLEIWATTKK